jgi:hypothetical protein
MCFEPFLQWLVLAAMTAQPAVGAPAVGTSSADARAAGAASALPAPAALPEVIVTRHLLFAIPFVVDSSTDPTRHVVEVQLYVSSDRGAHWQLYGKVPPNEQRFLFRTAADSEYWFVIRTLDSSGRLRPETIGTPGLRVLVDSRPLALKLTARLVQPKQVSVRWEVDKASLKPDSLSIQYRALPSGPWQAVLMNSPDGEPTNTAAKGEAAIWLKPGEGQIQIRGEIADTAGNMGFAHAQVRTDEPINARQTAAAVATQPTNQQSTTQVARTEPATQTTATRPAGQGVRAELMATTDSHDAEPKGSVAIRISPAIGRQLASTSESSSLSPSIPGLPRGERPRMVNSRLFELEYDVDAVGPSGIGRVELWGTRDGGQTWRNYAVANERRNALMVTVDEEGIYGFRVLVINGAGIGAKPPKSGDLPDLWVGVDLTKPTARIASAQQGVDAEAGHLIITWQADDNMLAARPISLSFSQNRAGPWLPIASGLENISRYSWPIDEHTPARIYLRIEVRDEAGNLAIYETPGPVTIDQSQPSVHIRDVRSLGQSAAAPRLGKPAERRDPALRAE